MKTIKMHWFRAAVIMLSCFAEIVISLPITSKPLDNTPEHLAWEAWIMVPQTHNKTRKITPKSIFILPNKATSPQVSCPPGYIIENSKCIQTVQIDSNAILLNHLANVLNNTNYDFDYDYDEFEEPHSQPGETGEGPLKIDLLNPTSSEYSTRGEDDYYGKLDENHGTQIRPLNGEDSHFATVVTSTTTKSLTSERDVATTAASTSISTVHQELLVLPLSTTTPSSAETTPRSVPASTLSTPTTQFFEVLPKTNQSSLVAGSISTVPPKVSIPTTIAVPEATEFLNDFTESTEKTSINIDTEIVFTQADVVTEIKDFLGELLLSPNTTSTPKEEMSTHEMDATNTDVKRTAEEQTTLPVSTLPTEAAIVSPTQSSTMALQHFTEHSIVQQKRQDVSSTQKPSSTTEMSEETVQTFDDQDRIGNNPLDRNRFVYQHLDNHFSSLKPTDPATHVQEPLYTIKKIVEERKKQNEQKQAVIFPNDDPIEFSENAETFHLASEQSPVEAISSTRPTPLFTDTATLPTFHNPPFVPPKLPWNTVRYPPTAMTAVKQNAKPFWWLPSSWEIENNAEKPLLLRFWSRALPTASSSSLTPSTFRENSRRPTENLYREISSQEFYKVLGSRNSRFHSSTSSFP